jgi:hypothetical protein
VVDARGDHLAAVGERAVEIEGPQRTVVVEALGHQLTRDRAGATPLDPGRAFAVAHVGGNVEGVVVTQ